MKYALLIYPGEVTSDSDLVSDDERKTIVGEYLALLDEPGVIGAEQLQPAEGATTVRVDDGQTLITDGPFANTKEILGGLYLVEVEDLDNEERTCASCFHPCCTHEMASCCSSFLVRRRTTTTRGRVISRSSVEGSRKKEAARVVSSSSSG